jgi:hypothetical protein
MEAMLVVAVVLGLALGIGVAVGLVKRYRGGRRETRGDSPRPREPEGFRPPQRRRQGPFPPARSGFDPKSGTWKTWDGTPYGAIDTLLEDADGDASAGDFDGDGLPG